MILLSLKLFGKNLKLPETLCTISRYGPGTESSMIEVSKAADALVATTFENGGYRSNTFV